jgi:hypothetical protein
VARIGRRNILLSTPVTWIDAHAHADAQIVATSKRGAFKTHRVICAIPATALRRLLPGIEAYRHIHGQSFIRVYAQFSRATRGAMAERVPVLTVVPAPLQEIIPMDVSQGVYMIAYADNESAERVRERANAEWCAREVERALLMPRKSLVITRIQTHFWEEGTHYYDRVMTAKDRSAMSNPLPGVRVVGEAVSVNQGWVEGALETVEKAFAATRANKKYT